MRRGAIEFEIPEVKVILDEKKRPIDVHLRHRTIAEMMIEEFMLTANQAAATLAMEQELPFIYRVHEQPPVIKINLLHDLLTRLNLPAQRLLENPQPKDFPTFWRVCGEPSWSLPLTDSCCAPCPRQSIQRRTSGIWLGAG